MDALAIRAELRKILASPDFDASERNRRFLAHVVEEALAGRADRIKAYGVATAVFGRDAAFDPQGDPVVRIEAGRLRRSLERYYLKDGGGDNLRIVIPKGSYAPSFEPRGCFEPHVSDLAFSSRPPCSPTPSIRVDEYEAAGETETHRVFAHGLTRSIMIALTRFATLDVYGPEATADVDLVLTGGVELSGDGFTVETLLTEVATGRAIWGDRCASDPSHAASATARSEAADRIARLIAQPYGALFTRLAQRLAEPAGPRQDALASVVRFQQYWRTYEPDEAAGVRAHLEDAIAAKPDYAEAHACLSLVFINAHRFGHPIGPVEGDTRELALACARAALALQPEASWGRYALAMAYWFLGDVDGALVEMERGLALNPNDTRIMADLGQRYALLGRWDRAIPLLQEAFAKNPAQPTSHRIGFFLHHFAHGRHAEALVEARRVGATRTLYGHVACAAAAGMLGARDEADGAVRRIMMMKQSYGLEARDDLRNRNLSPSLTEAVLEGLRRAGLPGLEAG